MMKYNSFQAAGRRSSERGIAVLFALGILSLVIVSVLIFAHRSNIDRKVASAYARNTSAKYLAESALSRAILTLQHNLADDTTFYSSGSSDWDWLWKMDSETVPLGSNCRVRWQYVTNGESGSNKRIIGRFAYAILGQSLMNMNAVADHTYCIAGSTCTSASGCPRNEHYGISAAELDFDSSLFNFKNSGGTATLSRENLDAQKVGGKPAQYSSMQSFIADWGITGLGSSTSAGLVNQRLNSYFNISLNESLEEPDAWFAGDIDSSNKIKDKTEYYQRFLLNKIAADWNAMANKAAGTQVNDILKEEKAFYSGDTPVTSNDTGIPWLYHWSDTEGNWPDAATKAKQIAANLINYNAAESCPVVSDVEPKDWDGTDNIPSYTGNKRTWYLNECKVFVTAYADPGTPTAHAYGAPESPSYWYSWDNPVIKLKVTLNSEIINMYGSTVLDASDVKVYGKLSFNGHSFSSVADTGTPPPTSTATNSTLFDLSDTGKYVLHVSKGTKEKMDYRILRLVAAGDVSAGGIKADSTTSSGEVESLVLSISVGRFAKSTNTLGKEDYEKFFAFNELRIDNLKLILASGTENLDYSSICNSIAGKTPDDVYNNGGTLDSIRKNYSVDDPRNNLHTEDWVVQDETLGEKNKGITCKYSTPTGGICLQDPEKADDPAGGTISTAYIRHAPMKSLWELGAIHRAAPWQTINLKQPAGFTNSISTNLKTAGGGAYADGDFRILDQVTMQGGTTYTPKAAFGKINLYALPGTDSCDFNFAALFNNMPYSMDGKYDVSSSSGGTNITLAQAKTLAANLGKAAENPLYRRTDIWGCTDTDFLKLFTNAPDGTTALTKDAQQEQLLCRVINLTKAETSSDSAIVIVMAQSINDVTGTVYKDWAEDGNVQDGAVSTDRAKINAGYMKYDKTMPTAFPNVGTIKGKIDAAYGQYDNGADQITGEAKMLAYFLYDRDQQKWKLIQVKHEE